jgi:hypothetical protein
MREDSKMYREQYLPAWIAKSKHYATMMRVAGFWNEEKFNQFISECQKLYDQWFIDHPPRKHWLTRIKELVCS